MNMHFLIVFLLFPTVNGLITVKIYRNAIYRSSSICANIGNVSLANDSTIETCIWKFVDEYDCQTATYFHHEKICSMSIELCPTGSIEPSENNLASVICYQKDHDTISTCPSTAITTQEYWQTMISLWSFDNNTLDSLSNFNGIPVNNPTYITPGINGYGSALSLNQSRNQYVNVTAYRNLTYTSFTVEMWFYCSSLTYLDHGLFGQNHYYNISQLLHYIIRNLTIHLGFYGNDIQGSKIIQTETWYHVAFVYDYSSTKQIIYINGKLDNSGTRSCYLGTSGSITIGSAVSGSFSGYLDEVLLTMRAKNASEILDDATLVCWHSFDYQSFYDSGPLHLRGTAGNVTYVNGKINQAIYLNSNSSFYQIEGFVLLSNSSYSYSIAFWINPISINQSVLLHSSSRNNNFDFFKISPIGQLTLTIWKNSSISQDIFGPILSKNTWTHIASTYSPKLYLNGTLNFTLNYPITLTLGDPGLSYGMSETLIDEFRVYSQELNMTDINKLVY